MLDGVVITFQLAVGAVMNLKREESEQRTRRIKRSINAPTDLASPTNVLGQSTNGRLALTIKPHCS